ncbi:MAG: amidohydrolase family protein [Actinomycetota bacterium]
MAAERPTSGTPEWLGQVVEDVLDADREIIDPHHHLWPEGGVLAYGVDDLVADTSSGHNVVGTLFMECFAIYRDDGPEHLRVVGETEFVAAAADDLALRHPDAAPILGIVGAADLTDPRLDEILDAHIEAAGGRFRGIRDALARSREPEAHTIPSFGAEGKASDPAFQAGVRRLGERGLTYDSWHYHWQLPEFGELADATPDTTLVLDHLGTPCAIGSLAGKLDEIFETWRVDVAAVAERPNVIAKVGGLAMPDNGFGYHERDRPPTSDELLADQRRWYEHLIECFGPERCMFESNFPVDKFSLSYTTYWNAMQRLAAPFSEDEQDAMFAGTARRVYRV